MKKNRKLPGLSSTKPVPQNAAKSTPLRDSSISKTTGFNSRTASPINLGKASRAATKSLQSTSRWSNLLSATTSGGLAGRLSGVAGFSGGIGSLISGLTSLLGGGTTTPPTLVAYGLPTSRQQTISVGSSMSTPGVYGSASAPFESQSDQIVRSVKQALLNSSSLNDVIAEL